MTVAQQDFERIVRHGFRYRHNLNPATLELHDPQITAETVIAAGPHNRLSKMLIATTQASDGNLLEFARAVHGRELQIDGDAGPATLQLVDLPRCGHPDFELATEEELAGSWKKGCIDGLEDYYAVTMALQQSRMQPNWKDNLPELIRLISAAQHAVGMLPIWKYDLDGSSNMEISWGGIGGNTIGWNTVPRSFYCELSITGKIDTTWNPGFSLEKLIRYYGRLGLHEWFGHGVGLGHYPGSKNIMNPSITDGEVSWIGDNLESRMKTFFEGPIVPPNRDDVWGVKEWL